MPHFLIATTNDQAMRDIGFPLVEAGHRVYLASNGQEALRAITENAFDVLIIGVRLGAADCLDIINIAEASDPTIGVLLLVSPSDADLLPQRVPRSCGYIDLPANAEAVKLQSAIALAFRESARKGGKGNKKPAYFNGESLN